VETKIKENKVNEVLNRFQLSVSNKRDNRRDSSSQKEWWHAGREWNLGNPTRKGNEI
jgi:hypothetical protein